MKKAKCRKCGKPFIRIIQEANYCSAECERLSANPVAKDLHQNRNGVPKIHKPRKGKGSYNRKLKRGKNEAVRLRSNRIYR